MNTKDYELIAHALRIGKPPSGGPGPLAQAVMRQWRIDCQSLALELVTDNPRFNRDRFLKACGVD